MKRISHKTASEISEITEKQKLAEKLKTVKNKLKKHLPVVKEFTKENIFFISNGIVRCMRTSQSSRIKPQLANENKKIHNVTAPTKRKHKNKTQKHWKKIIKNEITRLQQEFLEKKRWQIGHFIHISMRSGWRT